MLFYHSTTRVNISILWLTVPSEHLSFSCRPITMTNTPNQAGYRDLGPMEQEDHEDSSTEVGDSLIPDRQGVKAWDEEELTLKSEKSRQSRLKTSLYATILSSRSLLDIILLLVIIGLLLERRLLEQKYGRFEGSGDITGFAPRISQQIKTFKPDFSFAPENASEFFTPATKQKWLDMVPKGLGYVKVDHPENYNNLPTPLPEFNKTVFTTAITHQLHCLYAVVEVYSGMASKNMDKVPVETPWHLNHCFEYLRQSIMCCGDTALEGKQTTFPDGVTGSDGWDAKHVCKNYGEIKGYLEENRADDEVWIGAAVSSDDLV